MFETIVVGTDGSPNAEQAVKAATRVALDGGGAVHLVAVFPPPPEGLDGLLAQVPEAVRAELDPSAAAAAHLLAAEKIVSASGVRFEAHHAQGDPAEIILDIAEQTSADLIVVGSRGAGPGRRFTMGTVSTKVSQGAPIAVLIVPAT